MVKMNNKPILVGVIAVSFILLFLFINTTQARSGCCSSHGGVCGCGCCDGTPLSSTCAPYYPSCGGGWEPQPPIIYGCTNPLSKNYKFTANRDDGSCIFEVKGCMDKIADNYNPSANTQDNNTCLYSKDEVFTETIGNTTEYKDDPVLVRWLEDTSAEGKEGKKEVVYKITRNYLGEPTNKLKISEKVVEEPKNKVILKGTNEKPIYWVAGIGLLGLLGYFTYLGNKKK